MRIDMLGKMEMRVRYWTGNGNGMGWERDGHWDNDSHYRTCLTLPSVHCFKDMI